MKNYFFKNVRKIWKLRSTVAICFVCFYLLIKQLCLCCKYCLLQQLYRFFTKSIERVGYIFHFNNNS